LAAAAGTGNSYVFAEITPKVASSIPRILNSSGRKFPIQSIHQWTKHILQTLIPPGWEMDQMRWRLVHRTIFIFQKPEFWRSSNHQS